MVSSKTELLVVMIASIMFASVFTTGCAHKKAAPTASWVNTDSMPGHATDKYYANYSNVKAGGSSVVYLGDPNTPNVEFGPRDVSFSFRDLK